MKLGSIYDFVVKEGILVDIRSRNKIKKKLAETKKEYSKLPIGQKKLFDKASLSNPFSDTRILNGDLESDIKNIMVGIDIEVGDLLLADRLIQKGKKIDLVLSHHPEGIALAGLYDVMGLQTDMLSHFGIPADIAGDAMKKRIKEIERKLHAGNHERAVTAAKFLGIPFMCCHTPADNHVARYLQKKIDSARPKTLKNLVDMLMKEPEYQDATRCKLGPKIFIGKPEDKAGKVMVDMTGGTEGSKEIYARISQAGVKTVVAMHLSELHFAKIKPEHINVVIAGHIASDNIGLNILLDKLQKRNNINIIECSGFKRCKRAKISL